MQQTITRGEVREWALFENEGQRIFGVLHRPEEVENPPLAIALHGFASNKCGSNRCYVTLAEQLVKVGIAVLRFDFRGAGDSEGHLASVSLEGLVSDAVTVFESARQLKGIDGSRIALFGSSLGGSIALMAAKKIRQDLRAIALWSPVASGELWYRDFLTRHPEHLHSDPAKILSSYRGFQLHPDFQKQFGRMFAFNNMKALLPLPILHMHGEMDEMVSIHHQEVFRACCGDPCVHYIKFPDAQHALGYSTHFPEVMEKTIDWFISHL